MDRAAYQHVTPHFHGNGTRPIRRGTPGFSDAFAASFNSSMAQLLEDVRIADDELNASLILSKQNDFNAAPGGLGFHDALRRWLDEFAASSMVQVRGATPELDAMIEMVRLDPHCRIARGMTYRQFLDMCESCFPRVLRRVEADGVSLISEDESPGRVLLLDQRPDGERRRAPLSSLPPSSSMPPSSSTPPPSSSTPPSSSMPSSSTPSSSMPPSSSTPPPSSSTPSSSTPSSSTPSSSTPSSSTPSSSMPSSSMPSSSMPPSSSTPPDHNCCQCGNCCFSDQSYVLLTLPDSITANPDPNQAIRQEVIDDLYSMANESNQIEVPYSNCGDYIRFENRVIPSGSYDLDIWVSRGLISCDDNYWLLSAGATNVPDVGGFGLFTVDWFSTDSCCGASSPGSMLPNSDVTLAGSDNIAVALVNNKCCKRCGSCCETDEDICTDGAVNENCPADADLPSCLRLGGAGDGNDFTACESCATSGNPTWDGTFNFVGSCQYAADDAAGKSIGGKAAGVIQITYSSCAWTMSITCQNSGATVWTGTLAGSSPVGTYTRTGGCDTTSSLTVEECP